MTKAFEMPCRHGGILFYFSGDVEVTFDGMLVIPGPPPANAEAEMDIREDLIDKVSMFFPNCHKNILHICFAIC